MLDAYSLADLWFFKAAAELQSFSKAADKLNITQGAVSQRVRNFEARLGVVLFERVGRRVVLTATGQRLLKAAMCLDTLEIELNLIKRDQQQSEISLSCIPSFAMDWLIPRMDKWYAGLDAHRIRIRAELPTYSRELLIRENIDVAIAYDPFTYQDLYVETIKTESIFPVAAPSYFDLDNMDDASGLLQDANLIHDGNPWDGAEPGAEWKLWLSDRGLTDVVDHTSGDFFNLTHLATRAALQGQGVAIGRTILISQYLSSGELIQIGQHSVDCPATYKVLTLEKPKPNSPVHNFIEWLKIEIMR